ncbi:hypothetical protein MNEG_8661 [Monoraphidium neglectum]|uniref:Fungal lipase-type domain-containing protein n=1 Tax=Monoraphidium neglectum TaxID=145388 RepID=A0A0D2JJ12_9CHLO|nr:hypothetical protein MNEG_8661 [Monoraphidium neglectum]KIY99302.1 hypothetical protein MNEG_8661 [Monoraphidium neglectum]|eukprot:XP_013898322.1 hypothetical protein MNEG_8661 [Monoraphidium neglectum]
MTDLVAHTEPYMGGHCHSGMLAGARAILQQRIGALEVLLRRNPGFEVHCMGHSLGGGVSALAAHVLTCDPSYSARLAAAGCGGVRATGFGSPPVFTRELAEGCAPYVTTVVHNHDLVPRTCVANLAQLQRELEGHRDDFFGRNKVAGFLRDSGAISVGKQAARALFDAAMAGGAARAAARSPAAQALVQAAASKFKQLHGEAMARDASGGAGGAGGAGAGPGAAAATPAGLQPGAGEEAREQRRLLQERDAAAKARALSCQGGRFEMEEAEAHHRLFAPGTLLYLKRWQETPAP